MWFVAKLAARDKRWARHPLRTRTGVSSLVSRFLAVGGVLVEACGLGLQDDGPGAAHGRPVVSEGSAADEADLVVLSVGAAVRPGETVRAKIFNEPPEERCHASRTPCNPNVAKRGRGSGGSQRWPEIEVARNARLVPVFTVTRESKSGSRRGPLWIVPRDNARCAGLAGWSDY